MVSTALAYDRAPSARSFDVDGRMHVASAPISVARISEYRGSEIPDADKLRLDPYKLYRLLRDPDELAKAASTFNGVPILTEHVPISASDSRPDLVVGATMSDCAFRFPYLSSELVRLGRGGDRASESGIKNELSAAYRFRVPHDPRRVHGRTLRRVNGRPYRQSYRLVCRRACWAGYCHRRRRRTFHRRFPGASRIGAI